MGDPVMSVIWFLIVFGVLYAIWYAATHWIPLPAGPPQTILGVILVLFLIWWTYTNLGLRVVH